MALNTHDLDVRRHRFGRHHSGGSSWALSDVLSPLGVFAIGAVLAAGPTFYWNPVAAGSTDPNCAAYPSRQNRLRQHDRVVSDLREPGF